jgi:hypothetical protein
MRRYSSSEAPDYHRFTKLELRRLLVNAGFCVVDELMAGGGDFLFTAAGNLGMGAADFTHAELWRGYYRGFAGISDGAVVISAAAFRAPHRACDLGQPRL